jgi:hypothetical protein
MAYLLGMVGGAAEEVTAYDGERLAALEAGSISSAPRNPHKGFPSNCLFAERLTLPGAEPLGTDRRGGKVLDRSTAR